MADVKALRPGITMESEELYGEDSWHGAVRLRGVDAKGRPFVLTLDMDELSSLTTLAEDGLAAFLESLPVEDVA